MNPTWIFIDIKAGAPFPTDQNKFKVKLNTQTGESFMLDHTNTMPNGQWLRIAGVPSGTRDGVWTVTNLETNYPFPQDLPMMVVLFDAHTGDSYRLDHKSGMPHCQWVALPTP